ncbi:MAG: GDP-L-fucose synthase family protein [Rhizomicrobium sp.]
MEEAPHVAFDLKGKRVWIAGHRGMVGSALERRLSREACEIVTIDRSRVDLRDCSLVKRWVADQRPDVVFLAAARVGGILANSLHPAEFLYDNLAIEMNVIEAARCVRVAKLLFLGSSCVYPKFAPQPIKEDSLLGGPLEPTNEWYAIAKIAGLKLAQACRQQYGLDFISAMPTNLYGPNDNFDLSSGHVMAALIRKCHDAKIGGDRTVVVWGTGAPRREFLHVDDCADALVYLMNNYSASGPVNVGCGRDLPVSELARLVARVVGFGGDISHDLSKPDGTPRKLLDISRLSALGWRPTMALSDGIARTYEWYLAHVAAA